MVYKLLNIIALFRCSENPPSPNRTGWLNKGLLSSDDCVNSISHFTLYQRNTPSHVQFVFL